MTLQNRLHSPLRRAIWRSLLNGFARFVNRPQILKAVAERLPADAHDLLAEALAAARAITDEKDRAQVLNAVAEHLPANEARQVLDEVLAAACAIADEDDRAQTLRVVMERLPTDAHDLLAGALAAASALGDEDKRAQVLSAVAERLPADACDLLVEALAAASALNEESHLMFLTHQTKHWLQLADCVGITEDQLFVQALFSARRVPRVSLLKALAEFVPLIDRLGGQSALRECITAIRDTAEWWP